MSVYEAPDRRVGKDRRSGTLTPEDRRWLILFLVPLGMMCAASVIIALFVVVRPISATLTYGAEVLPLTDNLCPGDALRYSVPVNVRDGDAIIVIADAWYSVDQNRNIVRDTDPQWVPLVAPTTGVFTFTTTVPSFGDDGQRLGPGEYQYRRGAQEIGHDGSTMEVPFTIREDCQ